MPSVISIKNLSKTYASGFQALKNIDLEIARGEIFALLGPNGAGKTTLIGVVCGLINASTGTVTVDGHDHRPRLPRGARADRPRPAGADHRRLRDGVGDLHLQPRAVRQAGQPGLHREGAADVSLWDKKDQKIMTLSGGMKRRVLIAKALSHEPQILFLDEPTAGVDVELRKDMWEVVRALRASGVTIILTTHYIEEAEEMADRVGVINKGEMILVEDKAELMHKLGKKQLKFELQQPLTAIPAELKAYNLALADDGHALIYTYDAQGEHRGVTRLVEGLLRQNIRLQGHQHHAKLARGHLRRPGEEGRMNHRAVWAIYRFEMARTARTIFQSIVSPVLSTSLYFIVFGAAIGSRIPEVDNISYGAFIVPGLIMLTLLTQSMMNASFGIYFPRFVGTIYEILSAPISYFEIVLGYVGAAATKSIILGLIILATAGLFVPLRIAHPLMMLAFLVLTAVTFSLFGFIIGIWADGFEKLQIIPLLIVTPLTFLGGSFYSINMLPPFWQTVTLSTRWSI